MRSPACRAGAAQAALLTGCWRKSPPRLDASVESEDAALQFLLESGAGALLWWRLRNSDLPLPAARLQELKETYLAYSIHAAQHEQEVREIFHIFRQAGIEPILIKGWAVGRLYAEAGLRPAGDIDLCVAGHQLDAAEALLNRAENQRYNVDLKHDEISNFGGPSFEELLTGSGLVDLDGTRVRVLAAEDNLRILCLHLLKHGAWRPLWLCDIAASLESRPANFDWERCLGDNERHARWILCAIGLAQQILRATASDVPNQVAALPTWVIPTVLRQWTKPRPASIRPMKDEFGGLLLRPGDLARNIGRRWHNPIQATVEADGEFSEWPKFPLQLKDGIMRAIHFLPQLPKSLSR